jgi:hypothetical protein
MIYFIVTTSIFNNCNIRKQQYSTGIARLKQLAGEYKIIIVENNGSRATFLDDMGCEVYYTRNNALPTNNKGYKELRDVLDCIEKYKIKDTDFIVKITGRYILEAGSEFIQHIKSLDTTGYDCILKYGSFGNPVDYKMKDCITGLIGMRCKFINQIVLPTEHECVEWKWAEATYLIEDDKIHKVNKLGIQMCPGSNTYFRI